jgi:hypothetical protein
MTYFSSVTSGSRPEAEVGWGEGEGVGEGEGERGEVSKDAAIIPQFKL